jgi:hypothetical protein
MHKGPEGKWDEEAIDMAVDLIGECPTMTLTELIDTVCSVLEAPMLSKSTLLISTCGRSSTPASASRRCEQETGPVSELAEADVIMKRTFTALCNQTAALCNKTAALWFEVWQRVSRLH